MSSDKRAGWARGIESLSSQRKESSQDSLAVLLATDLSRAHPVVIYGEKSVPLALIFKVPGDKHIWRVSCAGNLGDSLSGVQREEPSWRTRP